MTSNFHDGSWFKVVHYVMYINVHHDEIKSKFSSHPKNEPAAAWQKI